MSRIKYTIRGWDSLVGDLERVQRTPARARPRLEEVLARQSTDAQSKVHRHTGATAASHQVSSTFDPGSREWSGDLSWESEGVQWELDRGGEHSRFWDELYLWGDEYEDAIRTAFGSDD